MLVRLALRMAAVGAVLASIAPLNAQQSIRVEQGVGAKPAASPKSAPGPAAPPRLPEQPASGNGEVLSPLHAFLGIDPITGQFKPPNAPTRPARPPGQTAQNGPNERAATTGPLNGTGSETSDEFRIGDSTLDDFRTAITKAVDEHDDAALSTVLANLTRGTGYDQLSFLSSRLERLGYLSLFLYPLGIVLSELFGVWSRRHARPQSDRDRRYYARQCGRRLALAASATATIGLFWWAGENRFWWNEPERLIPVATVVALLLTISAGLRMVIARAARDYPVQVIHDLRMQQYALENEIKELRRRLQGDAVADAV